MVDKYFSNKEQSILKYETEMLEKQRKEDEETAKREQGYQDEEKVKRNALLQELVKHDRDSKIKWDFNQKVYHIMRDVTNESIHSKAHELYGFKGMVKQIKYSEGDPTAIEQEHSKYKLSNTNQFEMTDKMSGEQNRLVYDQVRPSYFVDMQKTPILDTPALKIVNSAGNDITMHKYKESNSALNKGILFFIIIFRQLETFKRT
jgi:hypothetical protein